MSRLQNLMSRVFRRDDPKFDTWQQFEEYHRPQVERDKRRGEQKREWGPVYHFFWWILFGWRQWLYESRWSKLVGYILLAVFFIVVAIILAASTGEISSKIPDWPNQH